MSAFSRAPVVAACKAKKMRMENMDVMLGDRVPIGAIDFFTTSGTTI